MVCPECRGTENYYGILAFPGQDIPTCPNHKTAAGEPRPVELRGIHPLPTLEEALAFVRWPAQ